MRIVVRGKDIREEPLLDTEEASAVEMYDSLGNLVVIVHRMGNSEYYGVTTNQDPDWEAAKEQLGYGNKEAEIEVSRRKKDFFDI